MCALDFGFGQRAVGGAHSTNNPGLIPASAVYVYTCTDPGVHVHRLGWQVTGTLARGRASSPVKPTSHCVCLDICIYDVYDVYIHILYTYIYTTVKSIWFACLSWTTRPLNFFKLFVWNLSVSLLD